MKFAQFIVFGVILVSSGIISLILGFTGYNPLLCLTGVVSLLFGVSSFWFFVDEVRYEDDQS